MKTPQKADTESLNQDAIQELSFANQHIVANNKQVEIYQGILDVKKERKEGDLALRPLFLNVGMVLSLLFAIVAINWKSYNDGDIVDLGKVEADLNEIIEIPASTQEPPPPPKHEVFKIEEVKDTEIIEEIKINLDVEVTAEEAVAEVEISLGEQEEEKVDEIFVIVEQEPLPVGGLKAFYAYLADELNYPPKALRFGVSGPVFVQFIIEKDGKITDAQVVKGIGMGCDEEALRVIQAAPPWVPGKQRGVSVRVKKIIPVRFVLADQ
ncbi:energy transducer TonB [Ekhidna sp. To15]|uniref:energy transducer TonB n=1 Tax=Ekhidna sp. To15 TaxID=3395267 RepID=UPI003F5265D4